MLKFHERQKEQFLTKKKVKMYQFNIFWHKMLHEFNQKEKEVKPC